MAHQYSRVGFDSSVEVNFSLYYGGVIGERLVYHYYSTCIVVNTNFRPEYYVSHYHDNQFRCKEIDCPTHQIVLRTAGFRDWASYIRTPSLQGRSQPHSPGWALKARVSLSSFFPQISINFSSNFTYFLPHFGPPGGRVAHPGRPWLRHCQSLKPAIFRTLAIITRCP